MTTRSDDPSSFSWGHTGERRATVRTGRDLGDAEMETIVRLVLKKLRSIDPKNLNHAGQYRAAIAVAESIQELERLERSFPSEADLKEFNLPPKD